MDTSPCHGRGRSAEVIAYDRTIRYRRRGTGRPVILLAADDVPPSLRAILSDGLAERFRIITPSMGGGDADLHSWLACFLEGLGLTGAGVVAAGRCCAPARALAEDGTEQISRLVLVDGAAVDGATPSGGANGSQPVLICEAGAEGRSLLARITAFLEEGPPGPLDRGRPAE